MKKFLAIILSICILICVCGCGASKTPVKPSKDKDKKPTSSISSGVDEEDNSSDESEDSSDTSSEDDGYTGNNKKPNNNNNNNGGIDNDFDESETTDKITIKVPGTENWSDAADAMTLTVSNESIGKFNYFGWFITEWVSEMYMSLSKEQKEQFCEYVFEGEKVNYIALFVDCNFYYQSKETGTDIRHFMESWHVGEGSLLDEIIKRKIPIFASMNKTPAWMRGQSPLWLKEGLEDDYARAVSNMVYDLHTEVGLNVVNVGLGDEPDTMVGNENSSCVAHYTKVMPLTRKYLDEKGYKKVGIIGPETCVVRSKWANVLQADKNIWDNLFGFSGHDFNTGLVTGSLLNQTRAANKPLFISSIGVLDEHTVAGDFFTTNKNGHDTIADYYTAMRNTSVLLNDINQGANVITLWQPFQTVSSVSGLDGIAPNFLHLYADPTYDLFSKGFATSANYDYFSQILQIVEPGATIYQCSNNKEGTMGGSFTDYTLNANAGRNPDGTWGINIFNKTDSTIAAPHKSKPYAIIPQPAKTITVNLDIVGLYGTGEQQFKMYSVNTAGGVKEDLGTITLVDGRGYVEVYPSEVISLRSVKSIDLNNKPLVITEVIKSLNVAYAGQGYMLKNGQKVNLNSALELKYYDDYRTSAIKYEAEDFAKLIGAQYEISGTTVKIYNEHVTLTINANDALAKYSGEKMGSVMFAEKTEIKDGKMYIIVSDTLIGTLNDIFVGKIHQYSGTGLVVVGDTKVVNLGRFTKLFQ